MNYIVVYASFTFEISYSRATIDVNIITTIHIHYYLLQYIHYNIISGLFLLMF